MNRGATRDSFLVRCRADGQRWTLYGIWPDRNQVQGPIPNDGTV